MKEDYDEPQYEEMPDPEKLIREAYEDGSTVLDLGNLGLTSLPKSLLGLKHQIKYLILGSNGVHSHDPVPNAIGDFSMLKSFPGLKTLDLSGIRLSRPEQIPLMPQLEELDISGTGLGFTDNLGKFKELKSLNLSRNDIMIIEVVGTFPRLTVLNLNGNKLLQLGNLTPARFPRLEELAIGYNKQLSASLEHLAPFKWLRYLDCSGGLLLPLSDLSVLKGLRALYLEDCDLVDIDSIAQLQALEILDLGYNSIHDISPLQGLINLKALYLSNNQIGDISSLGRLSNLEMLSLASNEIWDISPLSGLKNLSGADLDNNWIKNLLPLREWLQRSTQHKLTIPHILHGLSTDTIYVENNPIENPPIQYLEAGREAVLSYWDQQERRPPAKKEKEAIGEAKLIIVGNSGTGKTTLSWLLRHHQLPQQPLPSTHGLEFSTWKPEWTIEDREISINVIDFGGQEYYHDTHHLFFSDKTVFLLLWHPGSNHNQFPLGEKETRHFSVEYWLNAIQLYSAGGRPMKAARRDANGNIEFIEFIPEISTPVILVQTHADKYGRQFLDMQELQGQYPQLFEASSLDLQTGARSPSFNLLEQKIKSLYEQMSGIFQSYDASWINIRDYIISSEKETCKIMTITEFGDYFALHSEEEVGYTEEDIRTVCITLNHWGAVLYRYELEELKNIVVVNPQYFTQQVHILLTDRLRQKNGMITTSEIPTLLSIEEDKATALVNVLKTFKILFELPRLNDQQEPSYISPMYLEDRPAHVDMFLADFITFYKISYQAYFHKGVLLDCFQELGRELLHDKRLYYYWQWGMVIKRGDRSVCIEFDDTHLNQVLIRTVRKGRESLGDDPFIQDILAAFHRINKKYKVDLELSADGIDFVSRRLLLQKMRAGLGVFDHEDKKWEVEKLAFLLTSAENQTPVKRVFISYSSKDRHALDQLESHLKDYKTAGIITYWNDLFLTQRAGWDEQIKEEMNKADVLIMLLSPDYLATGYIVKEEIPIALHHLANPIGAKHVYWILLRPCNYEIHPDVAAYPIYPLKEKDESTGQARQLAISEHDNPDRQWVILLKQILS